MTPYEPTIAPNPDGVRESTPGEHILRGRLGVFELLFTVLAFNGPLALVVGFVPLVIGYGNGIGAPVVYIASGILAAVFAAGFVKMSRHVENPGGFYSFVALGLGRPLGLGASFLALVAYYCVLVGTYSFFGISLNNVVQATFAGPDIPWWVWAIALQLFAGVLGYFNLSVSTKVMSVLLLAEMVIIVAYDAIVFARGGANGIPHDIFMPEYIFSGSIGLALLFAIQCMGGFEATAIFRDEVRDPKKTIPRAAYLFIFVVAVVYAGSAWALISAIGTKDVVAKTAADPAGSFLETAREFMGVVGVDVISVLLCTSVIAAVLAMQNVLSRYVFNLGVDKIVSPRLGQVHRKHGSPARASIAISVLVFVGFLFSWIFGGDPVILYAKLSAIFGYAFLMLLVLTSVAIVRHLSRVKPSDTTAWHRVIAPTLSGIGFLVALYLATVNIDVLLTGGAPMVYSTYVLLYGCVIVGVIIALRLRQRNPDVYRRIGRQ